MNGCGDKWQLTEWEQVWEQKRTHQGFNRKIPLVALIRVRNEELILQDTLDHICEFADGICAYDDASADETSNILKLHKKVLLIIQNRQWQSDIESRLLCETRHRGLLLQEARRRFPFEWCMCCDADERYVGPIREFVTGPEDRQPAAVKIRLFDAYMTEGDDHPFEKGRRLLNFRRFFGPECRDILMLWKNDHRVEFKGLDSREPIVPSDAEMKFFCQHYGKSISYEQWEDTCNYYVNHFPWEPYGKKWAERKGRALHVKSDSGSQLYEWGAELFRNAVKIY